MRPHSALLGAALGLALASAALSARRHWAAEGLPWGDQGANLALAIELRESGGWTGWLSACLGGTYREANRHPLLPLLLAPAADRDPAFFPRARAAAAGLAAAGAALWVLLAARAAGWPAALAALGLLAAAPAWAGRLVLVGPEALLAPLAGAAWLAAGRPTAASGAASGALLGAFYLLKGSALPWAAGLLAGAALGGARRPPLAAAAGAFLAVCAPLLIRDWAAFGRPFYNVNMHIMWLDIYWEYYPLLWNGALEGVGAASYFAGHTPWEAAGRLVAGAVAVLKNAAAGFSPLGWPGGALLFAAAVAGWRAEEDRPRRTAAAAAAAALFLPAAWYAPVDPSDRYMLPVLPLAAFYAARWAAAAWDRLEPGRRLHAAAAAAALAALALAAVPPTGAATWTVHDPAFLDGLRRLAPRLDRVRRLVTDGDDFFLWLVRAKPLTATLPLGPGAAWRFAEAGGADAVLLFGPTGTPSPSFAPVFANERMAYFERR